MKVHGRHFRSLWVEPDGWSVGAIDQRRLPHEFVIARITDCDAAAEAIRSMLVHGAPLIGATAAYGVALAMRAERRKAKSGPPSSAFVTLRGGIGGLIDRLAGEVGQRLRTGVRATSVSRLEAADARGRFALDVEGRAPIFSDSVVLAVPARAASPRLAKLEPRASELLGAIPHASTAVVFLALRRQDVHRPLDATGYIVPRNLGSPVMAATWVSSKWRGRWQWNFAPWDAI